MSGGEITASVKETTMDQAVTNKVLTVRGPVEPKELGRVTMHEHIHADIYDWEKDELIREERPMTPERREFLLREAVPPLKECPEHGCFGLVDVSVSPWRAWPTFYPEISELTVHRSATDSL